MKNRGKRFTKERQDKWFLMLEAGSTRAEANELVGVSKNTIQVWVNRGKKESAGPYFEFHKRLSEIPKRTRRKAPATELVSAVRNGELDASDEALERLLVWIAYNEKSVSAVKLIFDRRRQVDDQSTSQEASGKQSVFDRLDELAALRERKTGS